MNKKGNVLTDIFVFMIFAFILMIAIVIIVYASTTMYTKLLQNADVFQNIMQPTSNATTLIQNTFGQVPNAYESLKWITVALIFGMMISIIIAAYMVRISPMFFIAYLFIWIIAIIISAPISNTYQDIYNNPILASTFSGFWSVNYIFENLPIWITVIGAISAILMIINMIKVDSGSYG